MAQLQLDIDLDKFVSFEEGMEVLGNAIAMSVNIQHNKALKLIEAGDPKGEHQKEALEAFVHTLGVLLAAYA